MMTRELLSKEHLEIDAMARELLDIVSRPSPPSESLAALRWRLNHSLMIHLVKEDQLLYPALRKSTDQHVASIATQFSTEMGGLAQAFVDYMNAWNGATIGRDWAGFGAATKAVLTTLRERIRREEEELYPRLTETLVAARRAAA